MPPRVLSRPTNTPSIWLQPACRLWARRKTPVFAVKLAARLAGCDRLATAGARPSLSVRVSAFARARLFAVLRFERRRRQPGHEKGLTEGDEERARSHEPPALDRKTPIGA